MKTAARLEFEQPHLEEHRASVEAVAAGAIPRGLSRLMLWFVDGWQGETPREIHGSDVWRDYVRADEDRKGVGGSVLGTPAYADEFRRFVEGSNFETDQDGRYARPMRAALAKMCGRQGFAGDTHQLADSPFMVRFLFRLGSTASISLAAESMGIPPQVQNVYAEQALRRLWIFCEVGPRRLS